jgi:hypothetical protein
MTIPDTDTLVFDDENEEIDFENDFNEEQQHKIETFEIVEETVDTL